MAKASSAREDLLDAATELFRARGYEGVGVAELLERSGAPRGSLYFHFPGGKEQIGVEAVERVGASIRTQFQALAAREPDLEHYVDAVFRSAAKTVKERSFDASCPIAAIASESSSRSPLLRAAVAETLASWEREVAAMAERWGMNAKAAAEFASAVITAMEGAMIMAKSKRTTEPMINAGKALKAFGAQLLAR